MKNTRLVLAFLLFVVMAAAVVAGCATSSSSSSKADDDVTPSDDDDNDNDDDASPVDDDASPDDDDNDNDDNDDTSPVDDDNDDNDDNDDASPAASCNLVAQDVVGTCSVVLKDLQGNQINQSGVDDWCGLCDDLFGGGTTVSSPFWNCMNACAVGQSCNAACFNGCTAPPDPGGTGCNHTVYGIYSCGVVFSFLDTYYMVPEMDEALDCPNATSMPWPCYQTCVNNNPCSNPPTNAQANALIACMNKCPAADDDDDDNDDTSPADDDATPIVGYATGDTMPNFIEMSNSGVNVSLSDYKGKVILLDSSAMWCPVCKAETPDLQSEFYGPYQNTGPGLMVLQLIGEDVAGNTPTVAELENWATTYGLTFPILADPDWRVGGPIGNNEIPFYWVLDTNLKIVAKSSDGGNDYPLSYFLPIVQELLGVDDDSQ